MQDILDFKYHDVGKDSFNGVRHSHEKSYEIIFALSGDGVFLVDDNIFPIKPNHLYLVDGMSTHCSSPISADNYQRRKVIIKGTPLERILKSFDSLSLIGKMFPNGGRCIAPSKDGISAINSAFLEIENAISGEKEFRSARIKSAIIKILLIANDSEDDSYSSYDESMSSILKYLGDNFRKRLTLDEIGDAVHISKYYLCHTFKQHLNMTVFEYVLAKRISYAKRQLVYSDMSISQIALESGFPDFAYFSKIFKRTEGMSPKEYRLRNR